MASGFRPSVPADAPRLAALQARAFAVAPTIPFLGPDVMHWKYWEARDDWAEPRSFVIERSDRLIAHAAVWPAHVPEGDAEGRGAHIIDWAADSSAPGAGIAILQRVCKMFDFIYAIGGTRTARAVVPSVGFREIGRCWRAARPVRPWRLAMESLDDGWNVPPRLARNLFWSRWPLSSARQQWRYDCLTEDDAQALPPGAEYLPRPPAFFKYLSRCPAARCYPYRVHDGSRWRGFFLLIIVRHQARLALWLDKPTHEDVRVAYSLAQKAALEHPAVYELSTMGTTPLAAEAAVAAGLRIRQIAPVHLLSRSGVSMADVPDRQFLVTDSDAAFLDDGGTEFLC